MGTLANGVRLNRDVLNALPPEALIEVVRAAAGGLRLATCEMRRDVVVKTSSGKISRLAACAIQAGDRVVFWMMEQGRVYNVQVREIDWDLKVQTEHYLEEMCAERSDRIEGHVNVA